MSSYIGNTYNANMQCLSEEDISHNTNPSQVIPAMGYVTIELDVNSCPGVRSADTDDQNHSDQYHP